MKNSMQVITIFNEKGGVGKTTLTGLIGAGLAMRGHRVLLIDADGQGDLSSNMNTAKQGGFFRFVKWGDPESPDYVRTQDIIRKVPQDNCPDNLYIVPGNNDSWGIPGSTSLPTIIQNLSIRFNEIQNIFDYVLIDTQPSATMLHDAIGLITDWFICPTDAEPLSAYGGLRNTIKHIASIREQSLARKRDKAKLMGIIPNKFRMNTGLHRHVYKTLVEGIFNEHGDKIEDGYGDLVWTPFPIRTAIPESQLFRTTLMHDDPELKANNVIWSLVDRVASILKGEVHV